MYATSEDSYYIQLYLLLPLVLTAYERDKKVAVRAFRTPEPYILVMEQAMRRVEVELKNVRAYFKKNGIKVYEESRNARGINSKYLCQGYHGDMDLDSVIVRNKCRVLMDKYLGLDISGHKIKGLPEEMQQFDI